RRAALLHAGRIARRRREPDCASGDDDPQRDECAGARARRDHRRPAAAVGRHRGRRRPLSGPRAGAGGRPPAGPRWADAGVGPAMRCRAARRAARAAPPRTLLEVRAPAPRYARPNGPTGTKFNCRGPMLRLAQMQLVAQLVALIVALIFALTLGRSGVAAQQWINIDGPAGGSAAFDAARHRLVVFDPV